jgi:hypothetical protein
MESNKVSIIDNVLNTVAREVGKVQERSQEMMQSINLSSQIRELETKKKGRLMEIGRLIYDKYNSNKEVSEDVLKERTMEVAALDHEIGVLQAELDQIKVKNDPDATPSQKPEAKAAYSASPGVTCPSCSAPVNREKPFCPACGATLKNKNGSSDGTEEVEVDVEPHN